MPQDTGPTQLNMWTFAELDALNSEASMSCSAVSPARTSALPGMALASKVSAVVYGTNSGGLLATFDPESCSLRMYLPLLAVAERPLLLTLPRWGMTRDGELWALPTPERLTSAIAGSAWPTPNTMDVLPPRSQDAMRRQFSTARIGRTAPANLREAIIPDLYPSRLWPTPTASDDRNRQPPQTVLIRASGMVRHVNQQGNTSNARLSQIAKYFDTAPAHHLNPDWVETLMGYPLGWTDLDSPPEADSLSTPGNRLVRLRSAPPIGLRALKRSATRSCRRSSTRSPSK
jgi:hypothetical protein